MVDIPTPPIATVWDLFVQNVGRSLINGGWLIISSWTLHPSYMGGYHNSFTGNFVMNQRGDNRVLNIARVKMVEHQGEFTLV